MLPIPALQIPKIWHALGMLFNTMLVQDARDSMNIADVVIFLPPVLCH